MMTRLPSSAPPTSPLAVAGAVVAGKYRLDSIIGYGGMGSVWAATHLGVGREVAIKVISSAYSKSSDVRKRFDTEAKAVASLKSRHVVQVYDNGELGDGTPFIAMELLRGESLHTRVHRGGPIALLETAKIITQVCRALSKSHALGIVHRDIKPENIFLAQSDDDGDYVVKVLDFGIAKLSADGQTSSTQTGALLGTPLYMSPEQARGLKTIDHRTDIYSLGLVAYTMLTGNLAFTSESFGDLLLQICTAPLPVPSASAKWLPVEIDAWFDKACAREPQFRFSTALELAEGLAAVAGSSASQLRLSSEPAMSAQQMYAQTSGVAAQASGAALAPTMGSVPGVQGSGVMGPSAPSVVTPMMMSGALRSGPGIGLVLAAFAVVAVLAVGGVLGARWLARRGDASHAATAGLTQPASASVPAPPPSASATNDTPPADTAASATAIPTAIPTVPTAAATTVPPPAHAGSGRPRPPPPATGKARPDLGY